MFRVSIGLAVTAGILGCVGEQRIDFFISYAGADRAWAEWVAWQLDAAGYTVELDVWDWTPGRNFVTAMSDALDRADRVVALFSEAYFERARWTTEEWSAAVRCLVPVRLEDLPPERIPAVLRPLVFCDVFGADADQARRLLLAAAQGPRRPDGEPQFPGRGRPGGLGRFGGSGPRLPGSTPRVWNLPARNPGFNGRDGLLATLRQTLVAGDRAAVQAVQGLGGVGKTQLAAEYAYRFAGAYDLAWWIDSEQPALIGDQFAALGRELRCVEPGEGIGMVRSAVLGELCERGGWLLVFDNAQDPADITGWLPGGGGHVLITSRERKWAEIAAPVEVDVLARPDSVTLLQSWVGGLADADADQLAGQLGDLPLALAQAGGFMAETGTPAAQYGELLATQAGQLLAHGRPGSYPRSLAAATQLIADRLAEDDPAAAELANLCAFLAPEPIPEELFTGAASVLPSELAARAADPLAWRRTLAHLTRQALARVDQRGLVIHRLTQAILRDRLTPEQALAIRARTEMMLVDSDPGAPSGSSTRPRWARLLPHLLAADLAATSNPDLRSLACNACWYLLERGDARSSRDLASHLTQRWSERLDSNDESVMEIMQYLAWALRSTGQVADARTVGEDALARRRHALGEDHPYTLASARSLAHTLDSLGQLQAARDLHQETLNRCRRVLGEDDSTTLRSANGLAMTLAGLGKASAACDLLQDTLDRSRRVLCEDDSFTLHCANNLAHTLYMLDDLQAARDLAQDTFDRRRRVLGDNHPGTLESANSLALALRALGEVEAACDLAQDTFDRRRRVLGDNHPDTLESANSLALALRALGEVEAARDLAQDTLDRGRRVLGDDHPKSLDFADTLAVALRALGEVEAARDLAQDTFDRRRRVLGNDHPDTVRSAKNLAEDLRLLEEPS